MTTGILLAFIPALLSAGSAFTQTVSSQASSTSPVANVYVQGQKGVYVYNANSAGQLTLVKSSPFADTGQMEEVEGTYLISVGTDYLHSYHLESNGAVGSQASQINTQSYSGAKCGSTFGPTILDHKGQFLTVQLYGTQSGPGDYTQCSALQTYKLASNGDFTFLGDAVSTEGDPDGADTISLTTYSGNDEFAYGQIYTEYSNQFAAYKRATAGDLVVNSSFSEKDPTTNPSLQSATYTPLAVAADPSNHLAVVLNMAYATGNEVQLASYTINNTTGAIQSTNTYSNMPVLKAGADVLSMSWAGNLIAAGSPVGLEIFHFNGAAPATAYSGELLPNVSIDQLAWDKSNHLYALSYASGELYVYTVTSSTISEAPGSPYKIPGAYGYNGMIVVPKL